MFAALVIFGTFIFFELTSPTLFIKAGHRNTENKKDGGRAHDKGTVLITNETKNK